MGSCSSTADLLQPPPATVHARAPVHPASTLHSSTGNSSTSPLHGVLFDHPSMGYCSSSPPPATVQPSLHRLLFNQPSTGSCSTSPPRGPVHPPQPARSGSCTSTSNTMGSCSSKPPNNAHCSSRQGGSRVRSASISSSSEGITRVQLTARDRSIRV